jgi:hypothetical protein
MASSSGCVSPSSADAPGSTVDTAIDCLRYANIASHSTVQTFYFDAEGLLKRHDYDVEVSGGTPAAHYVYQHEEFCGIIVPTRRRVLGRGADGTSIPEPLIVSIDLSAVEFS